MLEEIKIDYAFNYKTVGENNISSELKKACPEGIDLYFDNVGGKHLEAAIDPSNLSLAITNRLRLTGIYCKRSLRYAK